STWPSGSTSIGFFFGILGGGVILFEFLLWPRKMVRSWRLGRAQAWMRAHIWLGLLTVPFIFYHSGFRFGGILSTALMVLLIVVVASGIWGLILQNILPRKMLEQVPAETIYSQVDRVAGHMVREADRLIRMLCGKDEDSPAEHADVEAEVEDFVIIGAVRKVDQVQGRVVQTLVPGNPIEGREALRAFYNKRLRPYLLQGREGSTLFVSPMQSASLFTDLRNQVDPSAHAAVDSLEGLADQRRQFDLQRRMHYWLHNWLWLHLPLSIALVVLMFVHIWVALKFW
ncbi:MAG: hypothetical protein AB7K24_26070, partial [Gemmataceae bacterium]